ncbi:sigma-54-dependent Fis family transcriptional regulator [Desulfosarcina ovata subsp. sediminis]|uniref:Sigma-54-dependent Fis family transcriptional regulator n=1 Tax=Desulfosarcina ovata subsp. sediminis TaxID=885957 RepID=A0A5K7ZZA1_9BACT|nr:sigma-54 dependent transcriptional regulator [Desulfosarcina ovata]BBO85615.1 sigma-54-dependent Fis family transcriptional regulator [Desulfosarcina ovata subsp. sediminis]
MESHIVVIDDEVDFLDSVRRGLITSGFRKVSLESDPMAIVQSLEAGEEFDIALIDITMPQLSGIELLERFKELSPQTECIMVTAIDEARVAVECLRKGAYDYLVKPISKEDLVLSLSRALERKRLVDILDISKRNDVPKLRKPEAFSEIVTSDTQMFKILKEAELHAQSNVPILISGETGTGKELLARAIHRASTRSGKRYTPVNMDALDSNLFSAEFFGHVKGAFTGAQTNRAGYLEETHRGTLFLDEIGNLSVELQGKLLRVLQDGEFIKIGASRPQQVDIRFIAATNADLEKLIVRKRFRKDLFYRLRGGWLHLPPLRQRKDDIPLLVDHFIQSADARFAPKEVTHEALVLLYNYAWPGNIRELKSVVLSAINLSQGAPIAPGHLPDHLVQKSSPRKRGVMDDGPVALQEVEKRHILKIYDQAEKNKSETARLLEISLSTLRRKLESYGVA